MSTFNAPKGTYDLLPPRLRRPSSRCARRSPRRCGCAGYGYVETPGVRGHRAVRARRRRVHRHRDQGDVHLHRPRAALDSRCAPRAPPPCCAPPWRPTCTSGHAAGQALVLRARYYRYERPQTGRYRHFSQVGAEALGAEDPALDAELIVLAAQALPLARACAASGCCSTRSATRRAGPVYRAALQEFLRGLDLDEDTRAPRRDQPAAGARRQAAATVQRAAGRRARCCVDYLCEACKAYHEEVPRAADAPRAWPSRTTRGWCAGWTTTPAPPSSSCTTGSARSPRSAAADATTGCPR